VSGQMEPGDFRFENEDFRFKSSIPPGKECIQSQSSIINLKS